MKNKFDFAIIGAGVSGAWIAYELSKWDCSVVVLEKENDVCEGTSKANSAIVHAGFDPIPGTLMAKLNVRGNELIRAHYQVLSIPFRQIGSLVVAFNEEGLEVIKKLYERGGQNGVPDMKLLSREETLAREKHLSDSCLGSLYAPTAGVCSPFELTAAPMDLAIENGVTLLRGYELKKVERKKDEKGNDVLILNDELEISTVINAAGVHSDKVAAMFGDKSFKIYPRKGEYSLLDNNVGYLTSTVIFQPPTASGKGILVTPTVDGNILVGPTAQDIEDPEDVTTTSAGQKTVFERARISVSEVSERDVITSFAGVRAVSDYRNEAGIADFDIGFSSVSGLYNVVGICSPGLTAAPAIGEYVASQLEEKGLLKKKKASYKSQRKVVRFMELSDEEKLAAIKKNPLYARVICRCESVTEGEIVDCIHRPCGAVDMDGVKRRVRAGMGRCQSGFCGPRVMEILSRELKIPYTAVTKFGKGSWMTIAKKGFEKGLEEADNA
jgi:glycerol-3-phosphate dehydrogenase